MRGPLDAVNPLRGAPRRLGDGVLRPAPNGAMNAHPDDYEGQLGTVYVLHFEPAYHHARHYIGWALDVDARLAEHLAGTGSPLVRAALAASVRVELVATIPGSRHLERRLKRWHKTGQFCPRCRAARGVERRSNGSGAVPPWPVPRRDVVRSPRADSAAARAR